MNRRRVGALLGASGAAAVIAGVIHLARYPGARCDEAFAANRWTEVRTLCLRASPGDPQRALQAALALLHGASWQDALPELVPLFDTAAGAGARRAAAYVHGLHGQDEVAEKLLREALALHQAQADLGEVASDEHQLTRVLRSRHQYDAAIAAAHAGLAAAAAAHDPHIAALLELALAELQAETGDETAARDAFARATALRGTTPGDQAWIALKHGTFVLELGDAETARAILSSALALAERHGEARVARAAHLNLAEAERLRGHLDDATRHLEASGVDENSAYAASYLRVAGLVAAARGDAGTADAFLARAGERSDNADYKWSVALERGRLAEARGDQRRAEALYRDSVAIVERLRAETSALELRPWVLARRRDPYEALFSLLARADNVVAALEIAEMLHARSFLDVTRGVGRSRPAAPSPTQVAAVGVPTATPLTGDAALAAIGTRETLIFLRAQRALWRFEIAEGRVRRLAPLAPDVDVLVRRWKATPNDDDLAAQLGAALIPAAFARSTDAPLYVIATEELAGLPLPALRLTGERLAARRPLVRAQGVTMLAARSRAVADGPPMFVGDVDSTLSAAREEVTRLARLAAVDPVVGPDATSRRVLEAGRARLLHLAVHATGGPGGLVLADGELGPARIAGGPVPPPLVVLAGCSTAVGADPEDWETVASAFLAAGACSVVATQQSVHDAEAAALIERFYQHGGDKRPAAALAAAQAELGAHHPVGTWAYFAVYGAATPDECSRPR
jgi:tetratricopeptide (TPR) repeat protein